MLYANCEIGVHLFPETSEIVGIMWRMFARVRVVYAAIWGHILKDAVGLLKDVGDVFNDMKRR